MDLIKCFVLLFISGCVATTPSEDTGSWRPPTIPAVEAKLIAVEVVGIFTLLPQHDPMSTTIQISPSTNALGGSLEGEFVKAGYGIQRVTGDQGGNYMQYSVAWEETDHAYRISVEVGIGRMSVKREYSATATTDKYIPTSDYVVSGKEIVSGQ